MNFCEGGKVEKASKREDLQEMLKVDNKGSLLYAGLKEDETALLTHGDAVTKIGMPERAPTYAR
jgi:GMP synthase-like glutamine amidotransferase